MHSIIYLNKQFLRNTEAKIDIADRCFLLGDGLFETLRADQKKIAYFQEHYERLAKSAEYLKIPFDYSESFLLTLCESLLEKNNLSETASLRITLSRGSSERGIDLPSKATSSLLITATAYSGPTKPITACITNIIRNEHSIVSKLKTVNYLENILARQYAKDRGFDEGILLNTQEHITETSIANLFFKIKDTIVTPPLSSGILPGIIRQQVLKTLKKQHISYVEKSISIEDIKLATHAFQTNSLIGLQVIHQINVSQHNILNLQETLPHPDILKSTAF